MTSSTEQLPNVGLLYETQLKVTAELVALRKPLRELMSLQAGDLLDLGADLSSPVKLYMNGKLLGHGEIVSSCENFGIKVLDISMKA